MDFLEKALHGSQLNGIGHKKDTRVKEEQLQNPINWNTHKVLKPIESKRSKPGDASDYWKNPAWNETEQDKKYNSGRTYTGQGFGVLNFTRLKNVYHYTCIMCVQCRGGGVLSTVGEYHDARGGTS